MTSIQDFTFCATVYHSLSRPPTAHKHAHKDEHLPPLLRCWHLANANPGVGPMASQTNSMYDLGAKNAGQDKEILQKRKEVYEAAKCTKPGRWKSRQTRNWEHVKEVWLNPPREHVELPDKVAIGV